MSAVILFFRFCFPIGNVMNADGVNPKKRGHLSPFFRFFSVDFIYLRVYMINKNDNYLFLV